MADVDTEQELNIDSAADEVAEGLFPDAELQAGDGEGGTDGAAPPLAAQPTAPGAVRPPSSAIGGGQPAPIDLPGAPAPDTLRGEIKEMWPTLPPQVRDEFIKREQDFRNGLGQLKEQYGHSQAISEGFGKLLEPFAQAMEEYGVNPFAHVDNLLRSHAVLMFGRPEQKLDIIQGICRDAGIDLRGLAQGRPSAIDPTVQGLQHELAQTRGALNKIMGRMTSEDASRLEQHIWDFGNDEASHPDFWTVAPDMVQLFRANPRLSLEEAYKQALVANPQTRQKLVEREAHARLEAERNKAVASRKTRGVKVQSGTDRRPAMPDGDDLDKTLRDTLAEIQSR